jgi:hypothetical protein
MKFIYGCIIYSFLIPTVILDLWITFYYYCFYLPALKGEKIKRSDFIKIDRHKIKKKSFTIRNKIYCIYCDYVNGVLAYSSTIAGRTEEVFCPIKNKIDRKNTHTGYDRFKIRACGSCFKPSSKE